MWSSPGKITCQSCCGPTGIAISANWRWISSVRPVWWHQKRLTGVTVLIAGIGAVGGIFGMSEAAGALAGAAGPGFYIVVAATLIATIVGVLVLRRIDWL